jgi:hypothetical protein
VDGDGAVLNQLADELNPHVLMLDLVIGLERREDHRCGLVVTYSLIGSSCSHARKRVTSRMCRISRMGTSSALIAASVYELDRELMMVCGTLRIASFFTEGEDSSAGVTHEYAPAQAALDVAFRDVGGVAVSEQRLDLFHSGAFLPNQACDVLCCIDWWRRYFWSFG